MSDNVLVDFFKDVSELFKDIGHGIAEWYRRYKALPLETRKQIHKKILRGLEVTGFIIFMFIALGYSLLLAFSETSFWRFVWDLIAIILFITLVAFLMYLSIWIHDHDAW